VETDKEGGSPTKGEGRRNYNFELAGRELLGGNVKTQFDERSRGRTRADRKKQDYLKSSKDVERGPIPSPTFTSILIRGEKMKRKKRRCQLNLGEVRRA